MENDGACSACDGTAAWPILVVLSAALVVPLVLHCCRSSPSMTLLVVLAMGGQTLYFLQSLNAIKQIDIAWVEPVRSLTQAVTALVSLNIQILGIGCFLPDNSPLTTYVLQLLAFPALVLLTMMVWFLAKLLRRPFPLDVLIRMHGLLIISLFTAITLMLFQPFECRRNPNGTSTVVAFPQVLCWQSADHVSLVAMAACGILAYPVSTLAWIWHTTQSYSKWLVSGSGMQMVERYRFLFGRFRPERHQYCFLLTLSNLAIGCTPALLVSYPGIQVGFMSVLFCMRIVMQCLLWPWRPDAANWSELFLLGCAILFLNLAAPMLNLESAEGVVVLSYIMAILVCAIPVGLAIGLAFLAWNRLQVHSRFKLFLCHHKATAGVLCRFLKISCLKHVAIKIFYDADNLRDLSDLYDIVRMLTDNMVVVLTPELLQSTWCVGEVTTAFMSGIPIHALCCDGYSLPDYDYMSMIESSWPENQRSVLLGHGISMQEVRAAFAYLHRLKALELRRVGSVQEQEAVVAQMLGILFENFVPGPVQKFQSSVRTARILIVSSKHPETISACLVLQQLVQLKMQAEACHIRQVQDLTEAKNVACIIFVLGRGSLMDPEFCQIVLATPGSLTKVLANDGTFDFPSPDFYQKLRTGAVRLPGDPHDVTAAYQGLCSNLALPLTPAGPEWLVDQQVVQICDRLGSMEKQSPFRGFSHVASTRSWTWEDAEQVSPRDYVEEVF